MFDDLIRMIEQAGDTVNFAPFGEGISEEWIAAAEERLQVKFPASYVWWLKNYNGGEIAGEEIYSIYGVDFDTVVGGDLVYINELSRKENSFFADKLIIEEHDDFLFYFDTSSGLSDGEYPVCELHRNEKYADSFAEFLKKRIIGP